MDPAEDDALGPEGADRGFGWTRMVGSATGRPAVCGGGGAGRVSVVGGLRRGSSRWIITVGSTGSGIAGPLARLMRTVGSVEITSGPFPGVLPCGPRAIGMPAGVVSSGLAGWCAASRRPSSARAPACCGSCASASSTHILAASYECSWYAPSALAYAASPREPVVLATAFARLAGRRADVAVFDEIRLNRHGSNPSLRGYRPSRRRTAIVARPDPLFQRLNTAPRAVASGAHPPARPSDLPERPRESPEGLTRQRLCDV
jgi:hypothetical protein